MTIREKLEEYNLFDQAIIRHGMLDYIRDYEVIGYLSKLEFDQEIQYIFKGCIRVEYIVKVDPKIYSMDDRLLDLERELEPDYPNGYIWGVRYSEVYPGLTLTEDSIELKHLELLYGMKFYKAYYDTNAYSLSLIFHDVETNEINRIEKKKNGA